MELPKTLWEYLGIPEQEKEEFIEEMKAIKECERQAWIASKDVYLA